MNRTPLDITILDYTRGARVARRDFRVENVQKTVAGDVNLTLRERGSICKKFVFLH